MLVVLTCQQEYPYAITETRLWAKDVHQLKFWSRAGSSFLTMIQYALSDTVSILMHRGAISPELLSRAEKLRRKVERNKQSQMENVNERRKCIDPSTSSRGTEAYEEPEGGAVWDIFRRRDVPKLEEYLKNHARELKHVSYVQQLVQPVRDQAFYLSVDHKRKLTEECGIEPWTFVQELGDAIFVPGGCPHQIRYLKSCTSVSFELCCTRKHCDVKQFLSRPAA